MVERWWKKAIKITPQYDIMGLSKSSLYHEREVCCMSSISYPNNKENMRLLESDKPYMRHKYTSTLLAESYYRLNMINKYEAVYHCGSMLKFHVCPNGHQQNLTWANFCRVRLCPMCAWRRSLVVYHQAYEIARIASENVPVKWLFLTLTCRNVIGDDLTDQLTHLMKSFDRMFKRKRVKDVVLGYFRALEVTHNNKNNTYHPHFHVMLAVKPSYFKHKNKYIKHVDWVCLWQDCLRVEYTPIVDIRVAKSRNKEREQKVITRLGIEIDDKGNVNEVPASLVAEVAKYTVKSNDYIIIDDEEYTDEIVNILDKSLAHRRLFAYGGILKDVFEYQKMKDVESDEVDLLNIKVHDDKCKCDVCNTDMLEQLYHWLSDRSGYVMTREQKVSEIEPIRNDGYTLIKDEDGYNRLKK